MNIAQSAESRPVKKMTERQKILVAHIRSANPISSHEVPRKEKANRMYLSPILNRAVFDKTLKKSEMAISNFTSFFSELCLEGCSSLPILLRPFQRIFYPSSKLPIRERENHPTKGLILGYVFEGPVSVPG